MLGALASTGKSVTHDTVVEVIADVRAFHDLGDQWNALLEAAESWNPFLTWEWMSAWWAHLSEAATLNLVTVRAAGELIAVAPLMIVRGGLSTPARFEFLGVRAGADYVDLIVRAGHEPAALEALARWLETQPLALHLDHLPPASLSGRLWQQLARTGWSAIESSPDVCPFIDLSGHTWESYLSSLGSSHRANVRRRLRALDAAYAMRFTAVESEEARRCALEALFMFHDQRWSCGGSTAFSSGPLRSFHHDLTARALERGWLRIYTLSLDDTLAAVMYGFAREGRFYFYQHGSHVAYAAYSLGLALMALTIRAAVTDGMREFDMLYGHETYKDLWARQQRPLGRLMLFPPRLAGRWLQRRAETRLAVRALFHRLGLKGSHDVA